MAKLFSWIKKNKLTALLSVVILYLLIKNRPPVFLETRSDYSRSALPTAGGGAEEVALKSSRLPLYDEVAPSPETTDRMVVSQSNLSMVVDDVRQKVDELTNYAVAQGGYMVTSSINQPQEAPFASLVLRVPSDRLKQVVDYFRSMAVKVTSENLTGRDVTDQYIDNEARLATLNKTKAKFEEILEKAEKVEDILRVQRELISLQTQIDNLKGQQDYLEKTAENAKLTVYLSSDEWSLPYAPADEVFRPKVIFKEAVRSVVRNARSLAKGAIWLGVYSFIWLPVLIIWLVIKRRK